MQRRPGRPRHPARMGQRLHSTAPPVDPAAEIGIATEMLGRLRPVQHRDVGALAGPLFCT